MPVVAVSRTQPLTFRGAPLPWKSEPQKSRMTHRLLDRVYRGSVILTGHCTELPLLCVHTQHVQEQTSTITSSAPGLTG